MHFHVCDNDRKHTSELIKAWLKRERIETLPWSPYSPDFNPNQNLWDELERRVKKYDTTGTFINTGME